VLASPARLATPRFFFGGLTTARRFWSRSCLAKASWGRKPVMP